MAECVTVGPGGGYDYNSIANAIKAAGHGDEICVAPGTYYETINLHGKRITVRSTGGPNATYIHCQQERKGIVCNKGEDDDCVIEGFSIIDGSSEGNGSGGGISIAGASPVIRDCRFLQCRTGGDGYYYYDEHGGGASISIGFPVFENCVFHQCSATGNGGAVLVDNGSYVTFTNCQFTDNWAQKGAGIYLMGGSDAVLSGCEISNNYSEWYGGGIYLLDGCLVTVTESTLYANGASMQGGGIYSQCGTVDLRDSVVEMNQSGSGGGVAFTCGTGTIQNVAFRDNWAKIGSDVRVAYSGPPPGDPLADVEIGSSSFCGSLLSIDGPWTDLGGNIFFGSCSDGACCTNSICVIIDETTCSTVGGSYQGVGTFCSDVTCPGDCPSDLDESGFVGADDLLQIISDWGVCP